MKKRLFFLFSFCLLISVSLFAQNNKGRRMGSSGGAARIEELGQAVFNALQQNQPEALNNYFPQAGDLRLFKRKSSRDMRAVLENNSPDSVRQNFISDFKDIVQKTTGNAVNWADMQLSSTNAAQLDKKNRQLYRVRLNLSNKDQTESTVLFEAFKIRNRYFLFRQMVYKPSAN